jgi:hypothetical protein
MEFHLNDRSIRMGRKVSDGTKENERHGIKEIENRYREREILSGSTCERERIGRRWPILSRIMICEWDGID